MFKCVNFGIVEQKRKPHGTAQFVEGKFVPIVKTLRTQRNIPLALEIVNLEVSLSLHLSLFLDQALDISQAPSLVMKHQFHGRRRLRSLIKNSSSDI